MKVLWKALDSWFGEILHDLYWGGFFLWLFFVWGGAAYHILYVGKQSCIYMTTCVFEIPLSLKV